MEEENRNPFTALSEMYQEGVDEADAKGYAEEYKRFTEYFLFKAVPEEIGKNEDWTFTPYDITYLDGYFVFGTGTNSVVHFKVKEAPGWLFGLWYRVKEETYDKKTRLVLHYELFAQYEQFIDKFKPSASTFEVENGVYSYVPGAEFNVSVWDSVRMFKFIITEPALAFCRDIFYWDYNEEYHSREEAEEAMNKELEEARLQDEFKERATNTVLEYFGKCFKGHDNVFIYYNAGWSPGYELHIVVDVEEGNMYHFKSIIEDYENNPEETDKELYDILKGYYELEEQLDQEAKQYNCYYYSEFSDWINVITPEKFKDLQKFLDENGQDDEDKIYYF